MFDTPRPESFTPDHLESLRGLKVGLALGGGAARGWAHIGVLQALDSLGIRPQVVAGTSIGAVVGGCYLADKLPQLEGFAVSLSRRRMFGLLDLNFGGTSLITGNKLAGLLEQDIGPRAIETLGQQFVAVCTEMGTGHEIWLSKGPLVPAIVASYALPGVFKPINMDGRWLIDGALVNPVPVSVCRAFGARLVIAVNLSTDLFRSGAVIPDPFSGANGYGEDDALNDTNGKRRAERLLLRQLVGNKGGPPGISAVMVDAFNIIQDRIARSRLAGDPPDVTIGPRVGRIGLFEFYRAREAIAAGREAVYRSLESLSEAVERLA